MDKIINIPIKDLISAPKNPFKLNTDYEMDVLIESIAKFGVIYPIIARKNEEGKYEIVSGHRRKYACEFLGIETIPTIVKELDRNEAVIFLVDSNLQREHILPSEKAFAYKMKMEAISHQGERNDLTSCHFGTRLRSDEEMAKTVSESARQIQRYIRLTKLIPEILQMVDEKKIALTPAVELSYLTPDEQENLFWEMSYKDCTPSLSQACKFKKLSQEGNLTRESISAVLSEEKPNQREMFKVPMERIRKFMPKGDEKQVEDFVLKACEYYRRYLARGRER